jgi:3-oxoacyl-[acyl-carrier-protein] synthase III
MTPMMLAWNNVCLESFGYTLPAEVVTSAEIEARLRTLYRRLRLPEGRLELMSGIRERRFWPRGTLPSQISVQSAERAIAAAGIDRRRISALVHGSVCRDFLEPATACGVHHRLGLPRGCLIYDVSNACLGIVNGLLQVANMIELGQIEAGLVVGTEGGRQLVETTIDHLNADEALSRQDIKTAMASLTIGSASVAVLLVHRELSRTGNLLLGGVAMAKTEHCELCHSGHDEAVGSGMRPLMQTDAERLLEEGVAAAKVCFDSFLSSIDWSRDEIEATICHQVGRAHRKALFAALELDEQLDFSTLEFLGNTGSAALPITAAIAAQQGRLRKHDRVALLGIGSGINVVMLGAQWQKSLVHGEESPFAPRKLFAKNLSRSEGRQ